MPSDTLTIMPSFFLSAERSRPEIFSFNTLEISDGLNYIFGAHIQTQFFCFMGLDSSRLVNILDNSSACNFKKNDNRLKHADKLKIIIEEILKKHNSIYWVRKLEKFGVPVGKAVSYTHLTLPTNREV